jgi:hypothetical protein
MERYACLIQESQHDLGLEVSSFDNVGRSAASFLWELAEKDANNQEQEASDEENYLTDPHYEQERITDRYSEDFEDDENKADRFTDDYREEFTD